MAECITNRIPELRSCVIAGEHLSNCDGIAKRWDREARRTILVMREGEYVACRGCLPRESESGMLCGFHSRQAIDALDSMLDLIVHLWSLNSAAPSADVTVASAYGSRWTLNDSRIRANEIIQQAFAIATAYAVDTRTAEPYLHPYVSPLWGFRSDANIHTVAVITRDLAEHLITPAEDLWKRHRGARALIDFIGSVRAALAAYPTEDASHKIPGLRCRRCNQLALVWHPPLYYRDDDAIKCDNCGAVEDRKLIEHDIQVILEVQSRKRGALA